MAASLIRHTVAAAGHDCHPFSLAKPLLRRLRHETFDLLIIDWQLPDLSGPDVARWGGAVSRSS